MKIRQNTFFPPTEARRERATCISFFNEKATLYVVDPEVTTLQQWQHFTILLKRSFPDSTLVSM